MIIAKNQIDQFNRDSVVQIKKIIDPSLCIKVKSYFLENESKIIDSHRNCRKILVYEEINGSRYVKYFEQPLHFCANIFGSLLTPEIFSLGQQFIGKPVRHVSSEIHSRYAGASCIPPHQDNAYYGLSNGEALTFYISLDTQTPNAGGLQYISNPNHLEYEHIGSKSAAFSLALADLQLVSGRKRIQPSYSPGDCTVHHSRSIHFADNSPPDSERVIIFRITFYSVSDTKKPNHSEWYAKMVASNRAHRNS